MSSPSKLFSLEGRGLKLDTAADTEPHIKDLRDNPDVEEVRLGGNTLGTGACEALAEALAEKKSLQVAKLADIFTSRLLAEIPPALSSLLTALLALPDLHTVDLSDNAFGLNTQAPLVDFLARHVPLRHLILNNNGLGPEAGALVANALTELHAKKEAAREEGKEVPDLQTVVCGRNRLENGSMDAWAKAYSAHKGVKVVKMVQNGIRPVGIRLLLQGGLKNASRLQVVDLQDNTFTKEGSDALAQVVTGWADLVELGVGECLLEARGAENLARALGKKHNSDLEILRLQFDGITVKGLNGFVDAAKTALPKLKRVEINGNKFSVEDEGVETLRTLLEERKTEAGGGDEAEDEWGLDELHESDMEDESDDEEEEGEESEQEEPDERDDEKEDKAERTLKDADDAENENVAQDKDEQVDELAEKLRKTEI
ncbi:MAG: hypothetical protein M1833_004792 [Piccolia ochrophora]|nr:MAG: hypothetical protein M1833_004792 [Piccolia ochrophora]